jgi:hypothetical protein
MQTITILFLSTNTFILSRGAADLSVIEFFSAAFYCRGTSDYMLGLMGQIFSGAATTPSLRLSPMNSEHHSTKSLQSPDPESRFSSLH